MKPGDYIQSRNTGQVYLYIRDVDRKEHRDIRRIKGRLVQLGSNSGAVMSTIGKEYTLFYRSMVPATEYTYKKNLEKIL